MTAYALTKGWTVTDEFVEPGLTTTDEKRPAFQAMSDAGLTKLPPFDKILVHSFSRLFRDQFQFEFYVRKLDRNHVRLISITQELGDDPMSLMMRQIMTLFDEYQSRENAKHTLRTMKENARQGFWNGSRPPFGYRVVDAGRRGEKMKRRLEIDPEQAEAVRLIFRLALRGDGSLGPMGVKAIAAYLNDRGVATRDGGRWGNGNVHHILTCPTYMGEHHLNVRSFKTGERKAPDEHAIGVAQPIIERATFEELQSLLKRRHPKSTADRIISGSVLLSGVAYCGLCGGPMHLASGKDGRYRYYACPSHASDGPASCGQVRVRMEVVDAAVIDFLETQLLCPPLLTELMADLIDHTDQGAKQHRRRELDLRKRMETAELRLARLYAAVEAGVLDADDPQLKDRIAELKRRRDKALHQTLQGPHRPSR
jgi:DNA invertase Pin-like site-specific DNA recombinase